jgi:hypothetical protein
MPYRSLRQYYIKRWFNPAKIPYFHGIIVWVLGSKQGPPTTPLHTGIVTLDVVVPFVVVATVKDCLFG